MENERGYPASEDWHESTLRSSDPAEDGLLARNIIRDLARIDSPPIADLGSGKPEEQTDPDRSERSAFTNWLLALAKSGTDQISPEKVDEDASAVKSGTKPKKKKKKKKKNKKKQRIDDDGLVLSDDVYSETLAELFESQGHYAEAIAMYSKLGLKYPDKSRFFAAKIDELKNKA